MPATHSAEFCLVREENGNRVTAPADPVLVHGNRSGGAKGPQPIPLHRRLEIRSGLTGVHPNPIGWVDADFGAQRLTGIFTPNCPQ